MQSLFLRTGELIDWKRISCFERAYLKIICYLKTDLDIILILICYLVNTESVILIEHIWRESVTSNRFRLYIDNNVLPLTVLVCNKTEYIQYQSNKGRWERGGLVKLFNDNGFCHGHDPKDRPWPSGTLFLLLVLGF